MRYRIPIGTHVEVRKRGERKFRRHVMRRELVFQEPQTVAYGGRVMYFEFGHFCPTQETWHESADS